MRTRDAIILIREKIREGHNPDDRAVTDDNIQVHPMNPWATAWSITAAVDAVAGFERDYRLAHRCIAWIRDGIRGTDDSRPMHWEMYYPDIVEWNRTHTQQQVVDMLTRVINNDIERRRRDWGPDDN